MNAPVEAQKKLKAKLGVTMHRNMSAKELLEAWDRVPGPIKALLPNSLSILFTTARTVMVLEGSVRPAYTTARTAYDSINSTIIDAAGLLTGNPNASLKVGATITKTAEQEADDQLIAAAPNTLDTVTSTLG